MKKVKEYNDFGELFKHLRIKNNLTYEILSEKINDKRITPKIVKKWEYELDFPDLNNLYKLSEIFQFPCEDLLQSKTETMQAGVEGINKRFIKWLSFTLGISIYSAIILNHVIAWGSLIFAFYFIYRCAFG